MLGKYHKLNYIDGFAGCGAYLDLTNFIFGCGSPVRATEVIKRNNINLQREVRIVIIEKEQKNIDNLKKVLNYKGLSDFEPYFIHGDFDKKINEILDDCACRLNPTFFLIDPFGFKIKYETLKRIMSVEKSEILLNFMYTRIQQFLTAPDMKNNMNDLFGCRDWQEINSIEDKREEEIIKLYRNQLKTFSKFVLPLPLSFPGKNQTYYYLFHLTNHIDGCSIMKDTFAKYNTTQNLQMNLFDSQNLIFPENYNLSQCAKFLLNKYHNIDIKFQSIIEENIDDSEFLERHFKETVKGLIELEKISITRIPATTTTGRPKRKIDKTDIIHF